MPCTRITLTALLALSLSPAICLAEEEKQDPAPNFKEETLTGDWGGLRTRLLQKGVEIGLTHKSDVLANVSGGIKNGTVWIGHTEATVGLDLEKLFGWETTTAFFHYHSDLGSKFNTHYVGGFMGVDNVEVGRNTAQFYHGWIEKSFFKESLALKAGLYPIDTEFYVTDTSGLFLAPPYGMSNEIAQTDTPAIFPLGALALRAKYTSPGKNFYLQGAIVDGVAGDPNNPHGTHIRLGHGEGTMSIVEIGLTPQDEPSAQAEAKPEEEAESFNKTAIGFWRYNRRFDDLTATDALGNPKRHHAQGAYILAERSLYAEPGHPGQGLAGFARFGTATEDLFQVDWTASLGLRYHGLFAGRDDDIAGIAVTVNHAGDKFRRASRDAGDPTTESDETDWELTYRAQIRPWLAVQPNLQLIVNPNMDKTLDNVWVVGFRTEVAF